MTTKEHLENVRHNIAEFEKSLADNNAAVANTNLAISAINLHNQQTDRRFAQIAKNFETIHDSLKALEAIAESNTTAITVLQTEWQAYLRRLPQN